MSLRTCSWLLPQKLHRYGTLVPLPELVDIAPSLLAIPSPPTLGGQRVPFSGSSGSERFSARPDRSLAGAGLALTGGLSRSAYTSSMMPYARACSADMK